MIELMRHIGQQWHKAVPVDPFLAVRWFVP